MKTNVYAYQYLLYALAEQQQAAERLQAAAQEITIEDLPNRDWRHDHGLHQYVEEYQATCRILGTIVPEYNLARWSELQKLPMRACIGKDEDGCETDYVSLELALRQYNSEEHCYRVKWENLNDRQCWEINDQQFRSYEEAAQMFYGVVKHHGNGLNEPPELTPEFLAQIQVTGPGERYYWGLHFRVDAEGKAVYL